MPCCCIPIIAAAAAECLHPCLAVASPSFAAAAAAACPCPRLVVALSSAAAAAAACLVAERVQELALPEVHTRCSSRTDMRSNGNIQLPYPLFVRIPGQRDCRRV